MQTTQLPHCDHNGNRSERGAVNSLRWRGPSLENEALAMQLGELCEAGRIKDAARARSVLAAWSRTGWTRRQVRLAAWLVASANPLPGARREIAPYAYADGGPWWADTRPERQAARGVKSGKVRRWQTRHRDREIARLHSVLGWSVRRLSRWYGLARSTIAHILARKAARKRARVPPRQAAEKPFCERPRVVSARLLHAKGRDPTLYRSVVSWLCLRVNIGISPAAVQIEARRLNSMLESPLSEDRVRRICRRAFRAATRFQTGAIVPAPNAIRGPDGR